MEIRRENLLSYLSDFIGRGDETAFGHQSGLRMIRWSYRQLATTSFQVARFLERRGIVKGDRVIIWSENRPEWVAAFWGCLLMGAIVVPLDEQSSTDFIERIDKQVKSKLILLGDEQSSEPFSSGEVIRLSELAELAADLSSDAYNCVTILPDDLAEIIFTSGTTAEPKGVCLSHRNLLANLLPLEKEIYRFRMLERLVHPLRFLCLLPLSHVFGQFMGMLVPQLLGGEVCFMQSRNPAEIISLIRREKINVASAVPRQLDTLRSKIENDLAAAGQTSEFREKFVSADGRHFLRRWWMFRRLHKQFGWRFLAFISGGATLDVEIENFWQRLSFAVIQGYGMTETASLISVNHPFKSSRGSIGRILPGHEVKIDQGGEIMVRGDNISAGYWQDGVKPLTGEEGWWRTGDIAAKDKEGNLFFRGRKKELIVTAAGLNIYPEDLEAALNDQPEVRDSCVFGVQSPHGPEPMAVILLREATADPAEIIRRANTKLNVSQHIRQWRIWDEADFPRTSTHKVRKGRVREQVLADQPPKQAKLTKSETLSDLIAGVSGLNADALRDETRLSSDLNLDSLGRVALLGALEDRYQVEIDESAITNETTVADIQKMISERSETRKPVQQTLSDYPYPRWALGRPVRWLRSIAYYLLVVPFLVVMCRPKVRGRERLTALSGPALFVANHISMVDPAMIMRALPIRFRHRLAVAMAGERLRAIRQGRDARNRFLRLFDPIRYLLVVIVFNVFPLPQKSGFRRSFSYAGEAMDKGYSVLVFPEGRTTQDGRMNPFMSGTGLLAENLNVPVVPIKIEGLFNLKVERRYFSPPGTVTVTIGEPVVFEKGTDPAEITKRLEQAVREL